MQQHHRAAQRDPPCRRRLQHPRLRPQRRQPTDRQYRRPEQPHLRRQHRILHGGQSRQRLVRGDRQRAAATSRSITTPMDNDGNDTIVFYEAIAPPATTAIPGVTITNNLLRDNLYGIFGSNSQEGFRVAEYCMRRERPCCAMPSPAPTADIPPATTFRRSRSGSPTSSAGPSATIDSCLPASRKRPATDGKDLGVDFAALNAAMNSRDAPAAAAARGDRVGSVHRHAIALPGRIEAEVYDQGGQGPGVSRHDFGQQLGRLPRRRRRHPRDLGFERQL